MQPSPIQLKDMRYLGIKVWGRTSEDESSEPIENFNFEGVVIGERIEVANVSGENEPSMFAIRLRITIANEEGKIAPYDVDIEAGGFFTVSNQIPEDRREELVTINGCAVLYSAIRDQVMTLTARSYNGVLILPTVNFLDKIEKKDLGNTSDKPRRKNLAKAKSKA